MSRTLKIKCPETIKSEGADRLFSKYKWPINT
jgi:hypothetical protein